MAEYDSIARSYQETRKVILSLPETYTYLKIIGDIKGRSVLELGCGEGFYTRQIKAIGAKKVVGVDISQKMIELAREQEIKEPLGVEYIVKDVMELGRVGAFEKKNEFDKIGEFSKVGEFDLVTVTFMLNHAQTTEQLLKMCKSISANLKPNGRFVIINNNLELSPSRYHLYEKYGRRQHIPETLKTHITVPFTDTPLTTPLTDDPLTTSLTETFTTKYSLKEGTPITVTLFNGSEETTFVDYYLSKSTYEWALKEAGLKDICWHLPTVSPEDIEKFGQSFWQDFLDYPIFIIIDGTKSTIPILT